MTDSSMGSMAILLAAERDKLRAERDAMLVARARAALDLDDAVEALRAFIAWMDDSRTSDHAANPVRYMAHCDLLDNAERRARAILAKHPKVTP